MFWINPGNDQVNKHSAKRKLRNLTHSSLVPNRKLDPKICYTTTQYQENVMKISYQIGTSSLICTANQLIGFCIVRGLCNIFPGTKKRFEKIGPSLSFLQDAFMIIWGGDSSI